MLADLQLPEGVVLVRTTPEFTVESVPEALLSAHRVAPGVWGRLCVRAGSVRFVVDRSEADRTVAAGAHQVIEPEVTHHIEPSADARFVVEFHR